jgi:hypothetical protein
VTYALPIGKGRKLMNHGGVLDYIFGGWNLTWVQTFQTGLPVMFTMAGSPNEYLPGKGVLRPNQPARTVRSLFPTRISVTGLPPPSRTRSGALMPSRTRPHLRRERWAVGVA